MTTTVNGPNGDTFNFPDGTDPNVIKSVMQKHYASHAVPTQPEAPSLGQTLAAPWKDFADTTANDVKVRGQHLANGDIGGLAMDIVHAPGDMVRAVTQPVSALVKNAGDLAGQGLTALGANGADTNDTHILKAAPGEKLTWVFNKDPTQTPHPLMNTKGQQMVYGNVAGMTMDEQQFRARQGSPEQASINQGAGESMANAALFALPGGGESKVISADPKVANPVMRLLNKATGGALLNPGDQARAILMSDMAKDGATAPQIADIVQKWQQTGASSPSFMDAVAQLQNGGQNVMSRIRGSAMSSPTARGSLAGYRQGVEGAVQDNAQQLTQGLNADPRSTQQFIDQTKATRNSNAENLYGPVYNTSVDIQKPTLSALSDAPGNAALMRSRASAVANRRWDQVSEIDNLLGAQDQDHNWSYRDQGAAPISDSGAGQYRAASFPGTKKTILGDPILTPGSKYTYKPAPPQLSAPPQVMGGTLDRARIQMREMAKSAFNEGSNDLGRGLSDRVNDIDASLANVPAFQPARADYGNHSAAMDMAQYGHDNIMGELPEQYGNGVADINKAVRPVGNAPAPLDMTQNALQIGARNRLVGEIGRPTEGSTGLLNKIASSPNFDAKLSQTFGDAAAPYQQAIGNEVKRVQNARFVDPTIGSKSAINLEDGKAGNDLVDFAMDPAKTLARGAIQKLKDGMTMTDAERQAIVDLGTSQVTPELLAKRTRVKAALGGETKVVGILSLQSPATTPGQLRLPPYQPSALAEGPKDKRSRKKSALGH